VVSTILKDAIDPDGIGVGWGFDDLPAIEASRRWPEAMDPAAGTSHPQISRLIFIDSGYLICG